MRPRFVSLCAAERLAELTREAKLAMPLEELGLDATLDKVIAITCAGELRQGILLNWLQSGRLGDDDSLEDKGMGKMSISLSFFLFASRNSDACD